MSHKIDTDSIELSISFIFIGLFFKIQIIFMMKIGHQ